MRVRSQNGSTSSGGRRLLAALAMVAFAAVTSWGQTVSITACGQTVPARQTGVLAGDLACGSGPGTFGVAIEHAGTLDLAGHTLAGGAAVVECARRCTVTSTAGAGTIRDGESAGIAVIDNRGWLALSNVDLQDNVIGVLTDFLHGRVTGTQVTLTGSGIGIQARKIRLTGLTATGNYRVAQARRTILLDSSISGTIDTALSGHAVVLDGSTVTGSGSGIDLLTERPPRLSDSTCGVSRNLSNPTQSWGVCVDD